MWITRMRDQLTAKPPQTPFSEPQNLSLFGVLGALAVPYLDTHGDHAAFVPLGR
jgi:hypothetical protein